MFNLAIPDLTGPGSVTRWQQVSADPAETPLSQRKESGSATILSHPLDPADRLRQENVLTIGQNLGSRELGGTNSRPEGRVEQGGG